MVAYMRTLRFSLTLLMTSSLLAMLPFASSSVQADVFTYSQVSIGARAACAVTSQGAGVCWGDNSERYLVGDQPAGPLATPSPIVLPNNEKFASVSVGGLRGACALAVSGHAYCWGEHHLGSYFTPTSRTPVQVEFPNDMRVISVQSGYSVACATNADGELWCWGDAQFIGDGGTESLRVPVLVPMPDFGKVVQYDLGSPNICVVTDRDHLYCWGYNSSGELALGHTNSARYMSSYTPTEIVPPSGVIFASVSVGGGRVCAISQSGNGYCWGSNYDGSFGDGSYNSSSRPVAMSVPDNETLQQISTSDYHTCVLTTTAKTWCFGTGGNGQLGTGTTLGGKTYRTPLIPRGTTFTSIGTGLAGTCALDTNGQVWCWGGLNWGSTGNGNLIAQNSPALISAIGSPTLSNVPSTEIDTTVARVNAQINPNGYATSVVVEYGTSPLFTAPMSRTVTASLTDLSYSATAVSMRLTNLKPRTTYYARFIGVNRLGTSIGASQTFTTLGAPPTLSMSRFSNLTGNEASISFSVNPGRLLTSVTLEYSTDPSLSNDVQTESASGATGAYEVERSVALTDLSPLTTYYSRVTAINQLGAVIGNIQSFNTIGSLPSASINAAYLAVNNIAVDIDITTGDTSGSVLAEASLTQDFTRIWKSATSNFSSTGPTQRHLQINGLSAHTNYFLRIRITNALGSSVSESVSLSTSGAIPIVTQPSVSPLTDSAVIATNVDTTGLATFVKAAVSQDRNMLDANEYFVYSGADDGDTPVLLTVNQLAPGTTYYVTISASNSAGTFTTSPVSFTTQQRVGVIINNGNEITGTTSVDLTFTLPENVAAIRISNNQDFSSAIVIPPTSSRVWQLLASSQSSVRREVWVQFINSDASVDIYTDSISLLTTIDGPDEEAPTITFDGPDEEAPTITSIKVATSRPTIKTITAVAITKYVVNISTRDTLSGVNRIQTRIGTKISTIKVDPARLATHSIKFPTGKKIMYIRVIDVAGNASPWKKVKAI